MVCSCLILFVCFGHFFVLHAETGAPLPADQEESRREQFSTTKRRTMATAASSPPSACPPKIQRRTFRGHRGPVLCLAHSSERPPPPSRGRLLPRDDDDDDAHRHHHHGHHPSLLLSGSEDGTARLWDLRTRRTSVCMVVPRGGAGGGVRPTLPGRHD